MPMRVPTIDGPSVGVQGAPNVRQQSVASPELLGAGARQAYALGEAASSAGGEIARIQEQQRRQFDALRVDDAINQAQEVAVRLRHTPGTGFADQHGVAALNRESGLPMADEYTGKLKEEVDKIGGSLTPQQRALYGVKAADVVRGFYGQALDHERTQRNEYTLSVRDATVASARNAVALNPSDTKSVDAQVDRIRAAFLGGKDENGVFIPGSAQMQGKSAAWAGERAAEAVSDAHGNAVKSLMEQGNVNGAVGYFNRYANQMVAKDVLEVQGKLTRDYDTRLGATVGDQVMGGALPALQPTDHTRLASLVLGAESAGRRYGADGKLLQGPVTRSGERAQGEMQVMPATYKDPGYGIKPADLSGTKEQQADEIARVGREKLDAMIKRYKGDVAKATAAYNWGEANVDKAVAEAAEEARTGAFRGGAPGPNAWLAKAPPETQAYVAGITAKYSQPGGGNPPKPTLAELHDQARAILGPGASPLAVKNAEERITQRFTDQEKAVKQRSEEVVARAMQGLSQNGGRFSELPASLRGDLATHAPEKIDEVMNFGARIAKGDDTTNSALYLRLSDPTTLRGMSEQQLYALRGQLSQSDYNHFVNERKQLLNPSGTQAHGDLNSGAIKSTLDARLRELNIDPTPKDDGSNDAARIGAVRRYVDEQVLNAQKNAGKKFTDAETSAFIDKLFTQSVTLRNTFLGAAYGAAKGQPLLGMKPGDIPQADRDAIKAAFGNRGVSEPTEAQILNTYLHQKTRLP